MYARFVKRFIDIIFSLIGLVFFCIIFVIIAPLIWLEDKGSVFYNGKRLGKNGKVFTMYKFRTMKENSKDIRNKDGSTYNGDDDPRLTKIGKILRKTSLDELPQLINVFIGNMSFIGPRPDLPEHIKQYSKIEKLKLNVLPGITGYNQAYYRNSIDWHERLKNDVYYVEHISFIFDLKIVFKTIATVLLREGIYVSNNKYNLIDLDWDTNYFGVKSGKVVLNELIDDNDLKSILKWSKNYEFVTIQNSNNISDNNIMIGKTKAFLTDVNVQFEKKVDKSVRSYEKKITIENNCKKNEKLLDIARNAYIYSRFINDINLDKNKSKLLYYNWLKNSFNNENKYISYYKEKDTYLGYCLFHFDEDGCVIELIAADLNHKRSGVGSKLLDSIYYMCNEQNIDNLYVGTQLDNIPAQNFYTKNGFKVKTYNSIYHLWK